MNGFRVAMIGQKGIPATFGGIEHHVEEIGRRLVERGHDVTVYARTTYATERVSRHLGMKVRYVPTVDSKHLDAVVHSLLSTLRAVRERPDVIHFHALGPGLIAPIPRYLSRAKVVQTVHGRDNERAKWSGPARAALGVGEWCSARVPDATIAVSKSLQSFYAAAYRRSVDCIPNGVDAVQPIPPSEIRARFGLRGRDYVLFVGRLVPEKAPDLLIRAFRQVEGPTRLVIAGGSSHTSDYVRTLEQLASRDERVVLAGYVYGTELAELYSNAAAFVLPSELEGLPLTLLEAAAYGVPVIASDIDPHLEMLIDDGPGHRFFRRHDESHLVRVLRAVLESPDEERRGASVMRDRIISDYRWDQVVDATEGVYERVVRRRPRFAGRRDQARSDES